jgi:hypothetical protein
MKRILIILAVVALFYVSRDAIEIAREQHVAEHLVQQTPRAPTVAAVVRAATPTAANSDPRERSLSTMRGAVAKAVRPCARSISAPVRVFVSSTATVDGTSLRASSIEVKTSAPAPIAFTDCVTHELAAMTLPAPRGATGSFTAHVSLLAP